MTTIRLDPEPLSATQLDLRHHAHLLVVGAPAARRRAARAIAAQLAEHGFVLAPDASFDAGAELALREELLERSGHASIYDLGSTPPMAIVVEHEQLRAEHEALRLRGRAAGLHLIVLHGAVPAEVALDPSRAVLLLREPSLAERCILDLGIETRAPLLVTVAGADEIGSLA